MAAPAPVALYTQQLCVWRRFKHGGRGWTNEFKAKRANSTVKDDLKSEGQMRKDAEKTARTKQHLQAKAKNKVSKKKGKGKGR